MLIKLKNKIDKNFKIYYYYSSLTSSKNKKKNLFSQTVLLPKTSFPTFENEVDYEKKILESDLIKEIYELQNKRKNVKEFNLLDGPPYANGDLHVGHAINKILKDIFCRYYVNKGYKVNFKPGWDCHGLPIELKVNKNEMDKQNPIKIRLNSENFALKTLNKQLKSFQRYGILADFNNPYYTCDKNYVTNQIKNFTILYKKKLIQKKFYPVYWSPSSLSTLAESELEYNNEHLGFSSYFKFEIDKQKLEMKLGKKINKKLNALIWTTTPWTIPSNMGITFTDKLNYSIVEFDKNEKVFQNELFLICVNLINKLEEEFNCKINIVEKFDGSLLNDLTYKHSLKKDDNLPFLNCSFIDDSKGTGLVHNSPIHGHEDYLLFSEKKLNLGDNFVSEKGCFNNEIKKLLTEKAIGLNIFKEGSEFVLEYMKNDVLKTSEYKHSFPYDWRTKEPVFTTVKNQFFMNITSIKDNCLDAINQVNFIPDVFINAFKNNIEKRLEWCISRQRCWGVPIPAFYKNEDINKINPIINEKISENVNNLILTNDANIWWNNCTKDFLPDQLLKEEYLNGTYKNYFKETDILDVWFDSGLAWNFVNKNLKQYDLVIEGQDQLRGWFLSSIILSVALKGCSPFKNIFVHGFALDKDYKKMSKSLGNVISPMEIVEGKLSYGVDVFRLWVSKYANSHLNVATKIENFESAKEHLQKWRKILRFTISNLNDFKKEDIVDYEKMNCLDQFTLFNLKKFNMKIENSYENYNLEEVFEEANNFLTKLSSNYFSSIKNDLYNKEFNDLNRRSIQTTLYYINKIINQSLSPIIPLFFYNFIDHHPIKDERKKLIDYFECPKEWGKFDLTEHFELLNLIKEALNSLKINETKSQQYNVLINFKNEETKKIFKQILTHEKLNKEINKILNISSIKLENEIKENNLNDCCSVKENLEKKIIDNIEKSVVDNLEKKVIDKLEKSLIDKLEIKVKEKLEKNVNDNLEYLNTENFNLNLKKTNLKKCKRCKLYVCENDQNLICNDCTDILKKFYPNLL